MIKAGERLPELKLQEFMETESEGCSIGPNAFAVDEHSKNKKVVILTRSIRQFSVIRGVLQFIGIVL